jgi:conjugal transfer ATP-binding protein TraC
MTFWSRMAAAITGDLQADPDTQHNVIGLDMLSGFLPWRAYDPTSRVFINRASCGFVVELLPLVGADDRVGDILSQFIQEGPPKGSCVQFLSWGSPRVSRMVRNWYLPRYEAGPFYRRLAQYRVDHLFDGVWSSLSKDAPFHIRHHRVFMSVGIPKSTPAAVDEMVACRDGLVGVLRSISCVSTDLGPLEIMQLADELTSPTTCADDEATSYNPFEPIADQSVRRDIQIEIEPHRLILRTERYRPVNLYDTGEPEVGEVYPDQFDVRHFGVRAFPERWAPWESARLIGDLFTDKLRLPCPTATFLCIHYPDTEASTARAGIKMLRKTSLRDSKGAKFMPNIGREADEWQRVQDALKEGQKLLQVFYGVTTFSPMGEGDRHERVVKSIYRAAGWDLIDERFLQIQGLLAALPLTLPDGLYDDMRRLKRFRTLLSSNAANIAPIQGEFLGGDVPHCLFVGRRGQPFFWSPFENKSGNHNVGIIGKSGSGKSVLLQELCASLVGSGAKVVVIDDGRSFQNSAVLQGGDVVEFTMASGFRLNPFAMIDADLAATQEDYMLDCMAMLKAIIGQMARFLGSLSDTERGLIDAAVNKVWKAHGNDGSIDLIAAELARRDEFAAKELALALQPYMTEGTFGGFFTGKSSFSFRSDFTVFELSDLSGREELRAVVLTAVMFMTQQMMTRVARATPKMLLIDEAWQLLRGGSMSQFVETYARTCRKYGGSLVTATESVNDFYKSDGARAALENSDWMLVLQQKSETVSELATSGRINMDETTKRLIHSLTRNGSEYSEVFIKGPDTQAVGRLVLDPFSAKAFSSSPGDFAAILDMQKAGLSLAEAVERLAFPNRIEEAPLALAAE